MKNYTQVYVITVISPLQPHPEPDDGGCGSVTRDRFGYTWIITCPNPDKH